MDYTVLSNLETRACAKPQKGLEWLEQSLHRMWKRIPLEELRHIAENLRMDFMLLIDAKGGHLNPLKYDSLKGPV